MERDRGTGTGSDAGTSNVAGSSTAEPLSSIAALDARSAANPGRRPPTGTRRQARSPGVSGSPAAPEPGRKQAAVAPRAARRDPSRRLAMSEAIRDRVATGPRPSGASSVRTALCRRGDGLEHLAERSRSSCCPRPHRDRGAGASAHPGARRSCCRAGTRALSAGASRDVGFGAVAPFARGRHRVSVAVSRAPRQDDLLGRGRRRRAT